MQWLRLQNFIGVNYGSLIILFPSRVITIVYVVVIYIVIASYSALWVLIIKFLAKVVLDRNPQKRMAIIIIYSCHKLE